MTQYCRYCCYLCVGDANYCSEKQQTMSDAVAKSPNRCHSFALNPIDAFGENERGYQKGDYIKFQAIDKSGTPNPHCINDKLYLITFVMNGWGIKTGYVVLGIKESDGSNDGE